MNFILSKSIVAKITSIYRSLTYINKVQLKKDNKYLGNQLPFITRVYDNPGISQEELSILLKIDRTTTSKAIKKLERQDLIIRKKHYDDKRIWQLFPSKKLIDDYEYILDYLKFLYSVTNCLTENELKYLNILLDKVEKSASILWDEKQL